MEERGHRQILLSPKSHNAAPKSATSRERRVFEQQITLTTQHATVVYRPAVSWSGIKLLSFVNCVQVSDCVCVYVYV